MSALVWNRDEKRRIPRDAEAWRVEFARWAPGEGAKVAADPDAFDPYLSAPVEYHYFADLTAATEAAERIAKSHDGPFFLAIVQPVQQVYVGRGVTVGDIFGWEPCGEGIEVDG